MNRLKLFTTIFALAIISFSATAQTPVTVNITQPDTVRACYDNYYGATLPNLPAGTYVIKMAFSFDQPNTSCQSAAINSGYYIKRDSLTGNNYTISNEFTDAGNGSWKAVIVTSATTTLHFTYHVYVDCSIIQASGSGSGIHITQQWNDTTTIPQHTYNLNNPVTSITTPFLSNAASFAGTAPYLDTAYIYFKYQNTGSTLNAKFKFDLDTPYTYCSQVNSLGLQYKAGVGTTYKNLNFNSFDTITVKFNDSLVIRWKIIANTCLQGCTNYKAHLQWKCNLPPADSNIFCSNCQNVYSTPLTITQGENKFLRVERMSPSFTVAEYDQSCFNDTSGMVQWQFRITNPGVGALDSVFIFLRPDNNAYPSQSTEILNFLSHIPVSSITTNCINCVVTSHPLQRNAFFCSNYVPDPLLLDTFMIKQFNENDTLIISFKTFRCAVEDDTLLNKIKLFNQWRLPLRAKGICNDNVQLSFTPGYSTVFFDINQTEFNISGHGSDDTQDLNQKLIFSPSVNSLTIPPGTQAPYFGDSTLMKVQFTQLIGHANTKWYDYAILNDTIQPTANSLKGWLKAVIHCDVGLRLAHPLQHIKITMPDTATGNVLNWLPIYYHDSIPDTVCMAANYYFYFYLHDSAAFSFMEHGQMEFMLQACCNNTAALTPYSIKFYLLPNPSGSCDSLILPTFQNYYTPPTVSPASAKWIPLSSVNDGCQIHCPGCLHPGAIPSQFSLLRKSYGYQDSNNNLVADAAMTQITDTSLWFQQYEQYINKNYSSYGDTLEEKTCSYFQDGDNTFGGYTYAQIRNRVPLHYLQMARQIPTGLDTAKLTPTGFDFYIDAPRGSNPANCIDCNGYGVNAANYRTQLHIYVPQSGQAYYLTSNTQYNYFLHTFTWFYDSITNTYSGSLYDTTHNQIRWVDSLIPFHEFETAQLYRLRVHYNECGHFNCGSTTTNLSDVRKQSNIQVQTWLTDSLHAFNAYSLDSIAPNDTAALHASHWKIDPTDPTPNTTLVNHTFGANYLFYCEAFSGIHYFISQEIENNTKLEAAPNCGYKMSMRSVSIIGGNETFNINPYPYEYKPVPLIPEKYLITIPAGYHVVSSFVHNELPLTNTISLPFTPPAFTGSFVINSSALPELKCYNDTSNINNSNQYVASKALVRMLEFNLRPNNCSVADSLVYPPNDTMIFSPHIYPCYTPASCSTADTLTKSFITPLYTKPNVKIKTDSLVVADRSRVCINVLITNPQVNVTPQLGTTNAYNIYLSVNNTANFYNWQFTFTGGTTINPNGNVFGLSPLLTWQSGTQDTISGKVCATYFHCISDSDSLLIPIHIGWNCDSFPHNPFDSTTVCHDAVRTTIIKNQRVSLSALTKNFPPHYTLCHSFKMTTQFVSNKYGAIYPDSLGLEGLPPFMTVQYATAYNCTIPNDTVLLTPTTDSTHWYITPGNLQAIGLNDTVLISPNNNSLCVSVWLTPICGYMPDTLPNIKLFAHKYCGDTMTVSARIPAGGNGSPAMYPGQFTPDTSHLSDCTDCFTITKIPHPASAQALIDTVTFTIRVCSHNGVSVPIVVKDLVPSTGFQITYSNLPAYVSFAKDTCIDYTVKGIFTTPGSCIADTAIVIHHGVDTISTIACVEVIEPCAAGNQLVPDSSFSYATFGYALNSASILLQGRFYIDSLFTFNSCNVTVATGGQIIVLPGGSFNLTGGTVIQGCITMWRGIQLSDSSRIISDRATIRDAEWGSTIGNKCFFNFGHTNFEDCVNGIFVRANPLGLYNTTNGFVTNCHFGLYATAFKPNFTGQTYHGKTPRAGMELNDIILPIIGNNLSKNYFHKMNNGIIGFHSNLQLQNNFFDLIQQDTAYNRTFNGTAVVSIGSTDGFSSITLTPVNYADTIVNNCYQGVYTFYSNLSADHIRFINVSTGIYSSKCTALMQSNVTYCTIKANSYGVYWKTNTGASNMKAENNTITVRTTKGIGISMTETGKYNKANYKINLNTIFVDTAAVGIYTNSVDSAQITCNPIKIRGKLTNNTSDGISLLSSYQTTVLNNSIIGNRASDTTKHAIFTSMSTFSTVQCNFVDSTGWGMYFGGDCTGANIRGNAMNRHWFGMYHNKTAVTDTQTHAGNTWLDTTAYGSGFGAINMNAIPQANVNKSRFVTNPTLGIYYNPKVPLNPFVYPYDLGWFFPLQGATYQCPTQDPCHPQLDGDNGSRDLKMAIAKGDTITSEFIAESKIIQQQNLYYELKKDSVLLASDTLFQNFVSINENSAIGKLYYVSDAIKTITDYALSFKIAITAIDSVLLIYSDSIHYVDSLTEISTAPSYDQWRNSLLNYINSLGQTKFNLIQQLQSLSDLKLQDAKTSNDEVTSNEVPLQNEQFINKIDIMFSLGGIDTIVPFTTQIILLAHQCPYSDGGAVYRARPYAEMLGDTTEIDDAATCLQQGIFRHSQQNQNIKNFDKIYLIPNPANKTVEVVVGENCSGEYSLKIIDVLGKEYFKIKDDCKNKKHLIDINTIREGIYIVEIRINDTNIYNKKLVVIK